MSSTATRYAEDRYGLVCLLLDVRSQLSPYNLVVWSYARGCTVKLPYKYRNGTPLIRNETPDNKRWAAVSVPRWLANREGLYGKPALPDVETEFCRQTHEDTRTNDEKRDDHERSLAQWVVDRENRYRRLPGQRWAPSSKDYVNGRIME